MRHSTGCWRYWYRASGWHLLWLNGLHCVGYRRIGERSVLRKPECAAIVLAQRQASVLAFG